MWDRLISRLWDSCLHSYHKAVIIIQCLNEVEQEDLVDCINHLKKNWFGYENMKLHCPVNRARIMLRGTISIKLINFRTLVLFNKSCTLRFLHIQMINELTLNVRISLTKVPPSKILLSSFEARFCKRPGYYSRRNKYHQVKYPGIINK